MILPSYPQSGFPVDANWGRLVVDALRALRVEAGRGLRKVADGPNGQVLEAVDQSAKATASDFDFSKFCFGFSISGATVTIIGGPWPIGEPAPLVLADTDVTISQDLQYVGLQVDTLAKTISVIGPSVTESVFYPDAQKFRCWLHQFNFSRETASLKRTRLGSLFMPSTFGATP